MIFLFETAYERVVWNVKTLCREYDFFLFEGSDHFQIFLAGKIFGEELLWFSVFGKLIESSSLT